MQSRVGIRAAILKDIEALQAQPKPKPDQPSKFTIEMNGKKFEMNADGKMVEDKVNKLKVLLQAKLMPRQYKSEVTGEVYSRSDEEQAEVNQLPQVKHSLFCKKRSRKSTVLPLPQSRYYLYHWDGKSEQMVFDVEHSEDRQRRNGGFAKDVKQGFIPDVKEPKYAVKVFDANKIGNSYLELQSAMRGAFCARLLGRTGACFRNHGKTYLVTDWLPGLILDKVTPESMLRVTTVKDRIRLALSLMQQVATLHRNGIVHCDIKPQNMLINETNLNLIDLDGARLIKTSESCTQFTAAFLDFQLQFDVKHGLVGESFDEQSDIFALGLSLYFLFPDVITAKERRDEVPIQNSKSTFTYTSFRAEKGPEYDKHLELVDCITDMTIDNRRMRPKTLDPIFEKLSQIYINVYGGKPEEIPKLPPYQFGKQQGFPAFAEIEKELSEFNLRAEEFNFNIKNNGPGK